MCRQRAGCNAGTLTARSWVEAAARDVQAKGRLQPWSSKGWRPGLVEAAAKELEGCRGFRSFRGLKPGKRQARMPQRERAMCRQSRVLGVLGVWSLANGRLEGPNKRGLCAGKGQAAMLERWRPGAWWKLARDVQAKGRLQPWSSKGWRPGLVEAAAKELEGCRGFRGLKPGKRQARMP